ncbi:phosphoribosyl 1,2-cyclic phosphate phosphodiesterase [Aquiflexum balticum DSM 16537]|uniref:Phosphoribosyl 1,2-cyclic phosphate phosphodiesterase n=1 Tax=Aquiflexum balticum DSM 16537 TaxID=758820 RepID=A0A1W2H5Y9_9BACT|nr:phosphoribosyl 1,2-cyclic phosphate phosphodiesterase [Aquiflexum balticum DSM 16537]
MKVTFLGTGTSQGVPVIGCACPVCSSLDYRDKRLRSSIHIEIQGKSLVIDTGPDFRQQMLRENIKILDCILFTHEHKDHTAGLDDIRSYNFLQDKDMPIYGTHKVLNQIKREFSYIFEEVKYPGVPRVITHEITNAPFEAEGIAVIPILVMHYRLPVFGFRFGDFTYITDAKYIDKVELEKIKGTKVLVLNALQQTHHLSHFTLKEAVDMVNLINPEQAFFTHISHKLGTQNEVKKHFPLISVWPMTD